eukprot:780126_1
MSTTVGLLCCEVVVTAESADDWWPRHCIGKLLQGPEVRMDCTRQENSKETEKRCEVEGASETLAWDDVHELRQTLLQNVWRQKAEECQAG